MVYTLDEISKRIAPVLSSYKIHTAWVFGSHARGSAKDESDIDLLVDTEGSVIRTLFDLGGLYDDLSHVLDKEVDLVTLDSLQQPTKKRGQIHFREAVEKEKVKLNAVA